MSDPPSPLRLFVAIELPPPVLEHIAAIQEHLRPGLPALRWVRPDNAHLTLRFIGEVPASRLPAIEEVLARNIAPFSPFQLHTDGLGTFGSARTRVLWLGLDGALEPLAALQKTVAEALAEIGIAGERGRFSPHLTLARVPEHATSEEQQRVREIAAATRLEPHSVNVSQIILVQSRLSPGGASYTNLAGFPPRSS